MWSAEGQWTRRNEGCLVLPLPCPPPAVGPWPRHFNLFSSAEKMCFSFPSLNLNDFYDLQDRVTRQSWATESNAKVFFSSIPQDPTGSPQPQRVCSLFSPHIPNITPHPMHASRLCPLWEGPGQAPIISNQKFLRQLPKELACTTPASLLFAVCPLACMHPSSLGFLAYEGRYSIFLLVIVGGAGMS